jgi:hypothetical protein
MTLEQLCQMPVKKAKQLLHREARLVCFGDEYVQQVTGDGMEVKETREGMVDQECRIARALLDINVAFQTCRYISQDPRMHERPSVMQVWKRVASAYQQVVARWKYVWNSA